MDAMEMTTACQDRPEDTPVGRENLIKAADPAGLEQLLQDYGDLVFRTCCLYLRDRSLAEDAVQETFIKAYEKYDTLRNSEVVKAWLLKIAINTCKNYLRNNWLKKVDLQWETEPAVYGSSPQKYDNAEQNLLRKEQQQEMLEAVFSLKEHYRKVIILYYYQDLKTAEISEILGISESLVRMRLHRGKKGLEKKLQEVKFYDYR